jgi:hypothetical protein
MSEMTSSGDDNSGFTQHLWEFGESGVYRLVRGLITVSLLLSSDFTTLIIPSAALNMHNNREQNSARNNLSHAITHSKDQFLPIFRRWSEPSTSIVCTFRFSLKKPPSREIKESNARDSKERKYGLRPSFGTVDK